MAKKRVFLDECCGDDGLKACFPPKSHVYVAKDFDVRGKEDPKVIDKAIRRRCLIVTVNKDFLDYYRNHVYRKGKRGTFFYGLIFLKPSKIMSRKKQLRIALKAIEWENTRGHDDLVRVSATGKTRHERLCHKECADEFPVEETEWD
jgi:predicted nuclease of predicted toxin-antitoxin system